MEPPGSRSKTATRSVRSKVAMRRLTVDCSMPSLRRRTRSCRRAPPPGRGADRPNPGRRAACLRAGTRESEPCTHAWHACSNRLPQTPLHGQDRRMHLVIQGHPAPDSLSDAARPGLRQRPRTRRSPRRAPGPALARLRSAPCALASAVNRSSSPISARPRPPSSARATWPGSFPPGGQGRPRWSRASSIAPSCQDGPSPIESGARCPRVARRPQRAAS